MAKELIKSNLKIKASKPQPAPYRLFDGDSLYLLISPDGKKWWRLDYTFEGKRKTVSLRPALIRWLATPHWHQQGQPR